MSKAGTLTLGPGKSIPLSGGRTVECYPVINDGSFLFIFTRPGLGTRPVTTKLRVSEEAMAAMCALGLTALKPRTELALAAGPEVER